MLKEITIKTQKSQELIDITRQVEEAVKTSKIKDGACIVYVPHATAGILINENYDPGVCQDIIKKLNDIIPLHDNYKHDCVDNNSHAHIKSAILGPSESIIIKNVKLMIGTWQGIALSEFDGPRTREIIVKII